MKEERKVRHGINVNIKKINKDERRVKFCVELFNDEMKEERTTESTE